MTVDVFDLLPDDPIGDSDRLLGIAGIVLDHDRDFAAIHPARVVDRPAAVSAPRFICSPMLATGPVIGPAMAMVMSWALVGAVSSANPSPVSEKIHDPRMSIAPVSRVSSAIDSIGWGLLAAPQF
jgi:hypothetical protein